MSAERPNPTAGLYGLAAEYDNPDQVMAAAEAARRSGYTRIDAYTPHPVEGLDEALGMKPTRLGFLVLGVGLFALVTGFFMQWYASVDFYPLNIGGRPLNSWPNFIVIMFEITVLFSGFTAGLAMLGLNGLPRLHHPMFNTPGFERATRDGYYLCIEAADPRFDALDTRAFLESTATLKVHEVPA